MIIGVIIDVVVRENDEGLPENIALLQSIKKDLDLIKNKNGNYLIKIKNNSGVGLLSLNTSELQHDLARH